MTNPLQAVEALVGLLERMIIEQQIGNEHLRVIRLQLGTLGELISRELEAPSEETQPDPEGESSRSSDKGPAP